MVLDIDVNKHERLSNFYTWDTNCNISLLSLGIKHLNGIIRIYRISYEYLIKKVINY